VKEALKVELGEKTVKEDVLRTALAATASFVNGRPLTHLSTDPTDPRPLTPNHFLIGRENRNTPLDVFEEAKGDLNRDRWVAAQQLTDGLWKRWLKEYLPELTERQKWTKKTRRARLEDHVLVVDPQAPRGQWAEGKISKLFISDDDEVRSVLVRIGGKDYKKPVNRLILLRGVDEDITTGANAI